jgi:hypothetical protein
VTEINEKGAFFKHFVAIIEKSYNSYRKEQHAETLQSNYHVASQTEILIFRVILGFCSSTQVDRDIVMKISRMVKKTG